MRAWITLCENMSAIPHVDKWLADSVLNAGLTLGIDFSDWETPSMYGTDAEMDSEDRLIGNIEAGIRQHLERDILPNVRGDQLRIFRAIAIPSVFSLRQDDLGIHWTTNKNHAHPYWGKSRASQWIILEGLVPLKDVWWDGTLALHLEGGEDEVRLDKNTPIKIIGAEWRNARGPVSDEPVGDLIGKTLTT